MPKNVNNRTVKLTQGDLMLRQSCDAIHFPPISNQSKQLSCNRKSSTSKTNANKAKSTQSVSDDSMIMADDAESDAAAMCFFVLYDYREYC